MIKHIVYVSFVLKELVLIHLIVKTQLHFIGHVIQQVTPQFIISKVGVVKLIYRIFKEILHYTLQ